MRTELDCIVCFMQQALSTARLSTDDPETHRLIVNETAGLLAGLDLSLSPPENAVAVYKQIARLSGVTDPFEQLKTESNFFALKLRGQVRERIISTPDPLLAAVRYAISGNIIDYGAQHQFDAMQSLANCMEEKPWIDDYDLFRTHVAGSEGMNILYLADNCGEIVFDGLLVEQLLNNRHAVTMAVRGEAILNDATLQSATDAGMDPLCKVISNGTSCPGTPVGSCSEELETAFAGADLIISKGQGNFETLSEVNGPIFFMLTVKCDVVARHIAALRPAAAGKVKGCGEMVLMRTGGWNA